MKNFKIIHLIALLLIGLTSISSCDNDNNNNPNLGQCNYPGLIVVDANQNIFTQITEADLTTDYYPSGTVNVYETGNASNFSIATTATQVGQIDNNSLINLSGNSYPCTITCQREGTTVGEEFRFDIVIPSLSNAEAELCVGIDNILLNDYPTDIIGTWKLFKIDGSTQIGCQGESTMRFANVDFESIDYEGNVGSCTIRDLLTTTYSINGSFITLHTIPVETSEILILDDTTLKLQQPEGSGFVTITLIKL